MKKLSIAKGLDLPLDAVTQRIACLGRTGSGKTFGSKRIVEQMLYIDAQVVVLDGAGVWAGLRLGPKSFDIPVLGGLFGDIPLEPTAGALIADLIADRGVSMVLDVSQMLDAERTRFATAFAQRFFQRKKAARSAVHLVLEECQDYVPQNPQKGEERMLHEFQRIAKQGRAFGIGLTLISQRPQEISKKVLNQTECVFAFQMTGSHERKALEYWLGDKGLEEKLSDILPKLEVGAPHVWSPQWLRISKVVKILPIDSLDTSSTPKVGGKETASKKLKPIDLKGLSAAMAETIERTKADDPKTLRAEISRLKSELDKSSRSAASAKPEILVQPMFDNESFDELQKFLSGQVARVDEVNKQLRTVQQQFEGRVQELRMNVGGALATYRSKCMQKNGAKGGLGGTIRKAAESMKSIMPGGPDTEAAYVAGVNSYKKQNGKSNGSVSGGLRRMMIALAQRPHGLTNRQLGLRAGLSSKSGTFSTYLSRGRSEGWITDQGDKRLLTSDGAVVLGDDFESLPEGRELLEYWLKELGGGASRMLEALATAYPNSLTNEELGAGAGISHKSGTFSTYLSRMRTLELVVGRGELKMSEELA